MQNKVDIKLYKGPKRGEIAIQVGGVLIPSTQLMSVKLSEVNQDNPHFDMTVTFKNVGFFGKHKELKLEPVTLGDYEQIKHIVEHAKSN